MVEIVSYQPAFAQAFKELNYQWIEQYFKIEDSDRKMLEDPDGYILQKGGMILIALLNSEPVGTCALIKMEEKSYELAKMAVSEHARGHKIGWELGKATVAMAREIGAERLCLETNSKLTPAINLYKKLGFQDKNWKDSSYERCNVQMELVF